MHEISYATPSEARRIRCTDERLICEEMVGDCPVHLGRFFDPGRVRPAADTRVSRNVEEMTAQASATPAVPVILAVRVIAAQDLLDAHAFDGRSHQLVYRPTAY